MRVVYRYPETDNKPNYPETPVTKGPAAPVIDVLSIAGRRVASAVGVSRAVDLAIAFGSGTQLYLRGERVGTYERGRDGTGAVPRSEVRRRLLRDVSEAARRIERREAAYIARMRAGTDPEVAEPLRAAA